MPAGTVLAVVPVGYWHGYPRKLSGGVGHVYIRGKKARVVGRVSMDMISVDITHNKDVVVGDEVELIGEHISAEEFASWAETINYEVVTRLNPYTKRVLVSLETATASAGSRYGGRN
jgi:alanine racemase